MSSSFPLILVLSLGAPALKERPKSDLIGEWTVISIAHSGNALQQLESDEVTYTIGEDKTLSVNDVRPATTGYRRYKATIDVTRKTIDLDPLPDSMAHLRFRGIYKVDGDRIILCLTTEDERPKDFDLSGDNDQVITLKRMKKKD